MSALPRRDVIEYPIEGVMDYSGWDFRKSLFLLNEAIDSLLARKRAGLELDKEQKILAINEFAEATIERLKTIAAEYDPREKPDAEILNRLLVSIVGL